VVDQQKKESLFFGKKLTRFGQLWVVGVWDLRARGNTYKTYIPQKNTKSADVSTQTRNLPVLEMAFPFPVMAPISSIVLLQIPLLEIFHLVRYPNWQSAITGTGRDSFVPFPVLGVPFPVLGYAISGTVIHWARTQRQCSISVSGGCGSVAVARRQRQPQP
jgi:hypothetical protein